MYERRMALVGAALSANMLATACTGSPSESGPAEWQPAPLPDVNTLQVACMEVPNIRPFTDKSCRQLAATVEAGLRDFDAQTAHKLKVPHVVPQLYPGVLDIPQKNVLPDRCVNLRTPTEADVQRLNGLTDSIVDATIKRTGVNLQETGLYVAANIPDSRCPPSPAGPRMPRAPATEQCPRRGVDDAEPSYADGRALLERNERIIFSFTSTTEKYAMLTAAHEWAHLGRKAIRLGHEYGLCTTKADQLPTVIGKNEAGLSTDLYMARGSLMSYGNETYIAPPQLAYLGVIARNQVLASPVSGEFALHDAGQEGTSILQLPLSNEAIKRVIADQLTKDNPTVDQYKLWIGKLLGRSELGVYAAPQFGAEQKHPPVFLLDILRSGQRFTIEGGATLTVGASNERTATISLQRG